MDSSKLLKILKNNKGNLGVDIDDTLVPLNDLILSYINKKFFAKKRKIISKDIVLYYLEDLPVLKNAGIKREDIISIFKEMEKDLKIQKLKPMKFSIPTIKILGKNKYVNIITARSKTCFHTPKKTTHIWLSKLKHQYGFEPKNMIFDHAKSGRIEKLGITLFIEDNPDVIINILKDHKNVIVLMPMMYFNIMNRWDNKFLTPKFLQKKKNIIEKIHKFKDKRVFIFKNWKELYDLAKKIDKTK